MNDVAKMTVVSKPAELRNYVAEILIGEEFSKVIVEGETEYDAVVAAANYGEVVDIERV